MNLVSFRNRLLVLVQWGWSYFTYDRSARLMNLKDYGIKVGSQAEVAVIDAKTPAEAEATNAPVLAVFKRGRQTVRRPRAELLRPQ